MKLSCLILAKNEEEMISDCLKQLTFADEIIVLDQKSTDKTVQIAKQYTDKIFTSSDEDFGKNRSLLAQYAKGDWLLYLDCDERISSENIKDIKLAMQDEKLSAYYFARRNFILGREVRHGGWWPDFVPRLIRKSKLKGWTGKVHESPQVEGDFEYMKIPIVHLTARSINIMLSKSIRWAKIEAELRYEARQSQVTILKTIKAVLVEITNRYVKKEAFLDGTIGLIESIYQGLHQAMVMVYLWEIQNDTENKRSVKVK